MDKKREATLQRAFFVFLVVFLILLLLFNVSNIILEKFGFDIGFVEPFKNGEISKKVVEAVMSGLEGVFFHPPSSGIVPEFGAGFSDVTVGSLDLYASDIDIRTVGSGNWEDASVWDLGRVPGAGDVVLINAGDDVTLNSVTGNIDALSVIGILRFSRNANTRLNVGYIYVPVGGEIDMGTSANPIVLPRTAEIHFLPIRHPNDVNEFGPGMTVLGTFNSYGDSVGETFVRMISGVNSPGVTEVVLEDDVFALGWRVGDRVVVPASRVLMNGGVPDINQVGAETEERIIQSIVSNPDGTSRVVFDSALSYPHPDGCNYDFGNCEFKPHLALLTRNVKITSDATGDVSCAINPTGTRGTISILDTSARFNAGYTEFHGLGRPFNLGMSPGRYALHFHHVHHSGQFMSLIGNSIWDAQSVGIRIHHADFLTVRDNVLYNIFGYGIASEQGNENGNVIDHNIVIDIPGCGNRPAHNEGVALGKQENGIGIFFMNGMNRIINNVVAGGASRSDYGVVLPPSIFMQTIFDINGNTRTIDVNQEPILEFNNNENYGGNNGVGLDIWHLRTQYAKSYIRNHKTWNAAGQTINYPTYNVVYENYTVRNCIGDPLQSEKRGQGFSMDDYEQANMELINFDIRGCSGGVSLVKNNLNYFVIRNAYLSDNDNGLIISGKDFNNVAWINDVGSRNVILKNISFNNNALDVSSINARNNYDYFNFDRFYFIDYDDVKGNSFEYFTDEGFAQGFYGSDDLCQQSFWGCNLQLNGGHYNPASMPACSNTRAGVRGFTCDFDDVSSIRGCVDNDGDGFSEGCSYYKDCDDNNAEINPNMPELCSVVGGGVDENCDGRIGNDLDGDGYGQYCSLGNDCDDSNAGIGQCGVTNVVDSCGESRRVLERFSSGQVFSGSDVFSESHPNYNLQEFSIETKFVWNPLSPSNPDYQYKSGYAIVSRSALRPYHEAFSVSIDRPGNLKVIVNNREFAGPYIQPGRSYNLAVTRAMSGEINVYLDGDLVIEGKDTRPLLFSSDPWRIGAREKFNGIDRIFYWYFYGSLEDFAFYNEVLEPGEIIQHVSSGNYCSIPSSCSDGDGDGYGTGCLLGADCDDSSGSGALIHPNSLEVAGDGVDNDCDLIIDECSNGQRGAICEDEIPVRSIVVLDNPANVLNQNNIHFLDYGRTFYTGILAKEKWNQIELTNNVPTDASGVVLRFMKSDSDGVRPGPEPKIMLESLGGARIGGVVGERDIADNLHIYEEPSTITSYFIFPLGQKNVEYRGEFFWHDFLVDLKADIAGYMTSNTGLVNPIVALSGLVETTRSGLGSGSSGTIDLSPYVPANAVAAFVIVSNYNNGVKGGRVSLEGGDIVLGFHDEEYVTSHLIPLGLDKLIDYSVSSVAGSNVELKFVVMGYVDAGGSTSGGQLYLFNTPRELYEGFGLRDSLGWQSIDVSNWVPAGGEAVLVAVEYQGGLGGRVELSAPSDILGSVHARLIGENQQEQIFLVPIEGNLRSFMFNVVDSIQQEFTGINEPYLRFSLKGYIAGPSDLCGTSDAQCSPPATEIRSCGTDRNGVGICSAGTQTWECTNYCRWNAIEACGGTYQGPEPEQCTDNLDNNCNGLTDASDPICVGVSSICGNGILESGEICDDGDSVSGDGCSATCNVEPGWNCDGSPSQCFADVNCGNGILDSGEQCDDADNPLANGDGCSTQCQTESGWSCAGQPSVCIDVTAPSISSVVASPNSLNVVFNENVEEVSAESIGNYLINNGVSVLSAVLQANGRTVVLGTSSQSEGVSYTLTVNNVVDAYGNVMGSEMRSYNLFAGCSDASLRAYLPFDDGTANDYSLSGVNDGIVEGASWSSTGRFGGAFVFDGVDDQISLIGSGLDLGSGDLTISGWARWTSGTGNARDMVQIGAHGVDYALSTSFDVAGQDKIAFGHTSGGNFWDYDAGSGLNDGSWHHVAAVKEAGVVRIYVDGVEVSYTSGGSRSYTSENLIGAGFHGRFAGALDEIAIFDRALNAGEIASLSGQEVCGGSVSSACSDGIDNDADGWIDLNDGGCADAQDNDESFVGATQCSNQQDDDGDGLIDGNDADCADRFDDSESSAIQIAVNVSRTSCVAPCGIFFDASETRDDSTSRPFHELDYAWNFGDPSSGIWAASGESKNTAKGAVAAHVFENLGTYNVALTVRDVNGESSSRQVSVVIQDPNVVFSGTNTICFSRVGDFSTCPAGAQQIATTSFDSVISYVAAGRRLLLRRGETWSTSSGYLINNLGPGIIGAYGTGAKPKIELTASNTLIRLSGCTSPQLEDWRFMDLEIYRVGTGAPKTFLNGGMSKKLLFLRIDAHDIEAHVTMDHSPGNYCNNQSCGGDPSCLGPHRSHDEIAVVENTVYNIYGGNAVYLGTERSMIMGNTLSVNPENTIPSEHVLRTPMIDKGVIQHNDIRGEGGSVRHVLKLHGPDPALDNYYQWGIGLETGRRTQYVVVSDNVFESRIGAGNVAISPSDSESDEEIAELVFERNYMLTTSPALWQMLLINARNVTVRNNFFDLSGGIQGGGTKTAMSINTRGIEPPPMDVHVYDNTAYNPDVNNLYLVYLTDGTDTGTIVRNNLLYSPRSAPNGWTVLAVGGGGTSVGLVQSNNADASAQAASNVFVNPVLNNPDDFALVDNAYTRANLIDRGFNVPVFDDYNRASRPQGAGFDIGAFEFGVAAVCGNNIRETGEVCDGTDLNGQSCVSLGFSSGALSCRGDCSGFDTISCVASQPCTLISASWNTASAVEGDPLTLTVTGNNCDGQAVSFVVREDDLFSGDDYPITQPLNVNFIGSTAVGSWTAVYQPDGFGGINDPPEFYFTASLVSNPAESLQSGLVSVSEAVVQCTDVDRDNYGIGDTTSCLNPEVDCDDTIAGVHPGAGEICDGVDNNCLLGVDENNGDCSGATPYCSAGSCVECLLNIQCSDGNGDTEDLCVSGVCNYLQSSECARANVNGEGDVDILDLAFVVIEFSNSPFDPRADVVADGIINVQDLIFVARRLNTC